MRYLVLSDIHGGAEELRQALSFFEPLGCDYLVLLGDLLNHGPRNRVPDSYRPPEVAAILNSYKERIIAVRGNCDSEVDGMMFEFPCNAAYGHLIISTAAGLKRVFLTHGHLHPFKTEAEREKLGLKRGEVVLSGHTHVAGIFCMESGVVNINPGSTTLPKGGTPAGFALVDESGIGLYTLSGERYTEFLWTAA